MKIRFYRWYNALLGAILAFLGYSCSDGPDEYGTPVEYGVPTARYEMKGTVTDEHGAALQGIKVTLKVETDRNPYEPVDSTQTDSQGRYLMKDFWNLMQFIFTAIGGWIGYFIGGCDGPLITLLFFVICDYITGILCAISDKKLSSHVGFKGICRKVIIFMLVGIAHMIDVNVIATGSILRTAVIFFYLSNEGVSLLENAGHLGLPIPEKLKVVLEQLHDRAEKDGE